MFVNYFRESSAEEKETGNSKAFCFTDRRNKFILTVFIYLPTVFNFNTGDHKIVPTKLEFHDVKDDNHCTKIQVFC